MKQQIITEIKEKLDEYGICAQFGNGTDVAINAEFLDAKWSTGSKKIGYEALIRVSESEKTVYMYEKTKETASGLSFGMSGETSFQSGSTLFRKVKSLQYGPEGKVYEYSFDLGAIPKAIKEAAKRGEWKFKTVLIKDRAMYPHG